MLDIAVWMATDQPWAALPPRDQPPGQRKGKRAWTQARLLDGELATAEPKTLRYPLLHAAARITRGARPLRLRIAATWPWRQGLATAFALVVVLQPCTTHPALPARLTTYGEPMNVPRARAIGATGVLAVAALTLSACGSTPATSTTANGKSAATATSAADFGGMDALVAAAKKEGTLNAIALPRDWADYGAVIDGFTEKYGIKVHDENPTGSNQDEMNAITSRKGQVSAPDVVDVGSSFALSGAQQGLFASYRVASYDEIPAAQKDSDAYWYNDYGGYISIGCDAKQVKVCPQTFADLVDPKYKGQVALDGDPTKRGAAFGAVYAAAMANGGSFVEIQPGIDFFAKLKRIGNFDPTPATATTIAKGQTPITIDWDYLNVSYADALRNKGVDWQVNVPTDGLYAQYYSQAINANAPHPAAARLWEEYLYSNDGQNLFLKGYARPALMDAMEVDGSLDPVAAGKLPPVSGSPAFPTEDQLDAAKKAVAHMW